MFYAENGMVASSDPRWIQGAFNTLVGLFYRVDLRTNAGKTAGMVCHPCQAAGNLSTTAYERRVVGGRAYIQVAAKGTGGLRQVWSCEGND